MLWIRQIAPAVRGDAESTPIVNVRRAVEKPAQEIHRRIGVKVGISVRYEPDHREVLLRQENGPGEPARGEERRNWPPESHRGYEIRGGRAR